MDATENPEHFAAVDVVVKSLKAIVFFFAKTKTQGKFLCYGQSFNLHGVLAAFKVFRNPALAIPHIVVPDIRHIDFQKLKDRGQKAIVFDKDNTITLPYNSEIYPPLKNAWNDCLRVFGKSVIIVSNSAGTPDDVGYAQAIEIEKMIGVPVLKRSEKKPSVVGDRVLTDVVYGNMGGALTVLVDKPLTEQGDNWIAARIRRMEKMLLSFLSSSGFKPPNHIAIK
ncbi:mitochondrial PGP phosphatase-domain-containing protein [Chytridium lagenaria]|nr:mitochondrial PGP phosphatase-domain-containing protein [Chytridium lagenaria]